MANDLALSEGLVRGRVHLVRDGKGGSWAADFTPNKGTGSTVKYPPWEWPNGKAAKTPSDVVLFHELTHSRNMANGDGLGSVVKNEPGFESRWKNMEEFNTVANENRYRAKREFRSEPTTLHRCPDRRTSRLPNQEPS